MLSPMTECTHKYTTVRDSRTPDYVNPKTGKRFFPNLPFACIQIRKRKCDECGHKFRTYEVAHEVVMGMDAKIGEALLEAVAEVLAVKFNGK